jgi:cell division protein FtsB
MSNRTWAVLAILVLMGIFAVQGGEYSWWDHRTLQRRLEAERDSATRLEVVIDSLQKLKQSLETDPKVQERIAREVYGMIRPGEHLYRITTPDP